MARTGTTQQQLAAAQGWYDNGFNDWSTLHAPNGPSTTQGDGILSVGEPANFYNAGFSDGDHGQPHHQLTTLPPDPQPGPPPGPQTLGIWRRHFVDAAQVQSYGLNPATAQAITQAQFDALGGPPAPDPYYISDGASEIDPPTKYPGFVALYKGTEYLYIATGQPGQVPPPTPPDRGGHRRRIRQTTDPLQAALTAILTGLATGAGGQGVAGALDTSDTYELVASTVPPVGAAPVLLSLSEARTRERQQPRSVRWRIVDDASDGFNLSGQPGAWQEASQGQAPAAFALPVKMVGWDGNGPRVVDGAFMNRKFGPGWADNLPAPT